MVKPPCSSCGVVALDVLDQTGVEQYMKTFFRALSPTYRRRATIVGIHNYGDVNRQRTTFTHNIIHEAHHYNSRHQVLVHRDRRDREVRPLVPVQHDARGAPDQHHVLARQDLPDAPACSGCTCTTGPARAATRASTRA